MYYASFGILAIVLHFIINHAYFRKQKDEMFSLPVVRQYRFFLYSVLGYYMADVLWGFLYDTRIIPLVYTDTVLYFLMVAVSVLVWTRTVVIYLHAEGAFSRFLRYMGWIIFTGELVALIINFFYPIFFGFEKNGDYLPGQARVITLAVQVVLFFMTSVYAVFHITKTEGIQRGRNKTVGGSGIVMSVFIVLQALFPLLPFYAIGLLIGTCVIHTFVEENLKLEYILELREVRKKAEKDRLETIKTKKRAITFGRIAESLAANYDIIYYVDTSDSSYVGYTSNNKGGRLEGKVTGDEFFEEARQNLKNMVYPEDQERLSIFLDREYLLEALKTRKQFNSDYRLMIEGNPQFTRIIVRKSGSGEHFIIAVENVDEEVRREKEQLQAFNSEKELARHDELTGTKNKTAYAELEQSVQAKIDKGVDHPAFALVVCDINDLKRVNDTEGHKAGDELICSASKMLCDIFVHSPVFRIGGDEFVIFLKGDDFSAREELIGRLRVGVFQNLIRNNGPVIAFGLSVFNREKDIRVSDVFERADELMYENKRELKEQQ